jgi:catecholate siderophore receptor
VPTNDPGPRVLQTGDGEPLAVPYRKIYWGVTDRDKDRDTAKAASGRVEHDLWNGHALLRNSFRYERTEQNYLWTLPDDSKGNLYFGLLFRRINDRVAAVFTDDNQTDLSGDFKTGKIKHSYATGMEFSKERGNNDAYTTNSTSTSGGLENCPNGAGAASGYNCTLLFSPNFQDPWTLTGTLALNHNPTHSISVTQSAYGFDTVQFNKHFQSTLGARYDHYDSTFKTAITAGVSTPYSVTNNIGTYLASLVYKPDSASSVYGTVSTAAIPTGNALAQGPDTSALNSQINANLQPERIREEEFGAKREVAHGKALARIDFYREDIQNVRITQADGTVDAAGNDRTLGAQIGISGMLTKKWQFTGGYDYIDAILTNAGGTGAANGQAMPNTAKHSASITSSYRVVKHLNLGGGIYAMSLVWGSQVNNKWVPGYSREDIFGNYEFNKHLNLQLNIQNVGNKLYFQQAYATHYAIPGPGRSAVVGFNVKF